jgi:mannose-6-phosphate isomerase-like protein (cupin superfamily)
VTTPEQPRRLDHALPPERFSWDRLEALIAAAPPGAVSVVDADAGRVRPAPAMERTLEGDLETFVRERRVQVQIGRLEQWSGAFDDLRDEVLEAAAIPRPRYDVRVAIRLFSPGGFLGYHAHGEAPVDCVLAGRCTWHVLPPETLTQQEHEGLHRGGQFGLTAPEDPGRPLEIGPGQAISLPGRWPHWVEHHGPAPTVTFEVEYWTPASARERKVHDVNFALRRARLRPRPPGSPRRDAVKVAGFDAVARLTGRGGAFVGA